MGSLGHVSGTVGDGSYHSSTAGKSHSMLVNAWHMWEEYPVRCAISNCPVQIAFCMQKKNIKMQKFGKKTVEMLNYVNEKREMFVHFR